MSDEWESIEVPHRYIPALKGLTFRQKWEVRTRIAHKNPACVRRKEMGLPPGSSNYEIDLALGRCTQCHKNDARKGMRTCGECKSSKRNKAKE